MEKKEEGNGYYTKTGSDTMFGRFIISSKAIKYSKLELAWRVGITVAVITVVGIALICLSV